MGFQWGDFYIGGLSNNPVYATAMAQAHRSMEAQLEYMRRQQGVRPTDFLSALMMQHYVLPNPIPWERRYADFSERLSRARGS
jgi:hypothetical protein